MRQRCAQLLHRDGYFFWGRMQTARRDEAAARLADAALKVVVAEEKVQKLLEKSVQPGECEELMHDVLEGIKVTKESQWGGTFKGNNQGTSQLVNRILHYYPQAILSNRPLFTFKQKDLFRHQYNFLLKIQEFK